MSDLPFGEAAPHYADDWLTVYQGDAATVLATLPAESVHCVVTSPPYWGLRDYGTPGQLGLEPTPEAYVASMVEVFREVRRVLRSDGTCWVNIGDSYATGTSTPSKPSSDNDVGYWNNADNIGRSRIDGRQSGLKPKDLVGIPWRVAFALQADGWYLRSDIIWSKPNPMPESVTDRPTKSHEYLFLLSKSPRYFYDADAVRETNVTQGDRREGNGRFVYDGKYDGEREDGTQQAFVTINPAGRNLRSVWTIATQPYPGAHFATFPQKLVEPCIKAGCPADGTVLDPFAGTGTVGLVAQSLSRRAVLIDLNAEYLEQCLHRNRQTPLGLGA